MTKTNVLPIDLGRYPFLMQIIQTLSNNARTKKKTIMLFKCL